MDFGGKLKTKIDKGDIVELEGIINYLIIVGRLVDFVDLQITNRTKKFIERHELK